MNAATVRTNTICRHWASTNSCQFGKFCYFLHIDDKQARGKKCEGVWRLFARRYVICVQKRLQQTSKTGMHSKAEAASDIKQCRTAISSCIGQLFALPCFCCVQKASNVLKYEMIFDFEDVVHIQVLQDGDADKRFSLYDRFDYEDKNKHVMRNAFVAFEKKRLEEEFDDFYTFMRFGCAQTWHLL